MNENQMKKIKNHENTWKKTWKPNKKFAKKIVFEKQTISIASPPKLGHPSSLMPRCTVVTQYSIFMTVPRKFLHKKSRRQIIIFKPLVKILRNVRDCTCAQPWWKRETSGQVAGTKQPHGVTKLFDWWGNGVWLYLGWFAFRESKGCSVTSHAPQVGQYWIQFQIISVMFHFFQFI